MKKICLILICLNSFSYSQQLRFGGTANFSVSNDLIRFLFGPGLSLEYSFPDLSISIQANTNFYIGEPLNRAALGASLHYFLVRAFMEPYLGAGFFYNFNKIAHTRNGYPILKDTYNNLSGEVLFGINLSPKDKICVISEISYEFNQPSYSNYFYLDDKMIISKHKFDLNSLFWKFGLMVNL